MKDKIESFLKKRVADLQSKENEYDELVLDDNFKLWTMLDSDCDGDFVFIELLGKYEDDFHYDEIMQSMTIDSIELVDDFAEYIMKKMKEIIEYGKGENKND